MNMPQNRLWIKKELRLLGFSLSGSFSIILQKRPSNHMLIWTLTMNVLSIFATLIGVFLATFELIITSRLDSSLWQHKSVTVSVKEEGLMMVKNFVQETAFY
ncbi:rCG47390 [Rattus norvegicus]|uniref:RCG47390 n=1 Tax=Rattus norvegicus TaxID=10116 RepID=A6I082_RAT|nr:rCG47390 [Rattus norvegicus]